jgi:predicted RNase H-like HicB family nuclease
VAPGEEGNDIMDNQEMKSLFTALIQRDGEWWIGWIEEIPGVNSQGRTRQEMLDNLRSALEEALEMNRAEALAATRGEYEEVSLQV